jgi:hypothetical protein
MNDTVTSVNEATVRPEPFDGLRTGSVEGSLFAPAEALRHE